MTRKRKVTDAVEIMRMRFGDDPETRRYMEDYRLNTHIAQLIHDARNDAELTQKQLAELVGTKQQVIARLEDADYQGHSLSMLRRLGEALKLNLEIRFVPAE